MSQSTVPPISPPAEPAKRPRALTAAGVLTVVLAVFYGLSSLYYQLAASTAANLGMPDQTVGELHFLATTSWIAGVVVAVLAIPPFRGFSSSPSSRQRF